jgi:hypothetical protein
MLGDASLLLLLPIVGFLPVDGVGQLFSEIVATNAKTCSDLPISD